MRLYLRCYFPREKKWRLAILDCQKGLWFHLVKVLNNNIEEHYEYHFAWQLMS